jgi:aryl-alcohol dehydrogenase-like predicted oxidoreductase
VKPEARTSPTASKNGNPSWARCLRLRSASIAKAHESTVARVALAWVQAQPGVTSTIVGARRLAQLEDNLKALEVRLSAEELGRLDALTKPTFGFPQSMQPWFPARRAPYEPYPLALSKGST